MKKAEPEFEPNQLYAKVHWTKRHNDMKLHTYDGPTSSPKRILAVGPIGSVNIEIKDIPNLVDKLEFWTESLRSAYRDRDDDHLDAARRPGWSEYLMRMARVAASRSSCSRLSVGAILVRESDRTIAGAGYNGAPAGKRHCNDFDHVDGEPCPKAIHAEVNAINSYVTEFFSKDSVFLYVTHEPCPHCANFIVNCGLQITGIVYQHDYHRVGGKGLKILRENQIPVYQYKGM